MTLEIQILVVDRQKNVEGLNRLMGPQPPLDSWISKGNAYINKRRKKPCTNSLPLKKTTYYHKWTAWTWTVHSI